MGTEDNRVKKLVVNVISCCAECPLAYMDWPDDWSPWGTLCCANVDVKDNVRCPDSGFLPNCRWKDYTEPEDSSFEAMGENPAL